MIPTPRHSQAASANRRVTWIHSALTRPEINAPTANANGTSISVYPEYSIGGWIIIVVWRSSGSRPAPSAGAGELVANGLANSTVSAVKNPASPNRTACAYGTISRTLLRVMNSAMLDQNESSITHSSSDPDWVAQTAAIR